MGWGGPLVGPMWWGCPPVENKWWGSPPKEWGSPPVRISGVLYHKKRDSGVAPRKSGVAHNLKIYSENLTMDAVVQNKGVWWVQAHASMGASMGDKRGCRWQTHGMGASATTGEKKGVWVARVQSRCAEQVHGINGGAGGRCVEQAQVQAWGMGGGPGVWCVEHTWVQAWGMGEGAGSAELSPKNFFQQDWYQGSYSKVGQWGTPQIVRFHLQQEGSHLKEVGGSPHPVFAKCGLPHQEWGTL
ncbi:hypothetical protein B0H14DRAFT_2626950 [Mycena olivaceomarginata]|nr:hypothetical protein B0H14DRAFT_2626950 [Mycena olivaceomarginata]